MPDIVGSAAVDVVPIIPNFHNKLRALVLPVADRVGEDAGRRMGDAISRNIVIAIPDAITRGGRAGTVAAGRQGDDAGGAFSRSLRAKLEAAFKAMPKLNVTLGATGVDAELDRIRAKLESLSRKRIGVDIDAGLAEAEIVRLEEQLRRLGAEHPNVQVRADTATARAALAEIRAEIAAVDAHDPTIHVKADTAGASSALMALGIQAAALTAIPAIPVALAGLGGIAAMATAAGAGLGALALAGIPAIKGVTAALTAKTAAEKEDTSATGNTAKANKQAATQALQMASAQATLTAAHRNAANSIAQANAQVATSERALSQAVQAASDQRRTSAENVSRAERTLADDQKAARQAEVDLTQARRDAAEQLKDLNNQLADGALSQRDATLRVQEAEQELAATRANPKSTALEIQRAQLIRDESVQGLKEQKEKYADLQKTVATQQKAGIAGNAGVIKATKGVADAQQTVKDQTQAVADAQRDAARAAQKSAQAIADAQRGVATAVKSAADAQVSAAESIASAERGVQSARLSTIDTTVKAATKTDDLAKALAKLTPEQRDLYDSIAGPRGLKKAFDDWQKSLQPETLPLFTRGVTSAKNALPGLTPLVKGAADAVGVLWDKASKEVKTPFWKGFKKDLDKSVKPAIVGIGKAFGNVITGIAGIIDAFLPHMDGIADRSDKITGKFAKWGKSLKGSPDFEKFLDYVKATAPRLADFIGHVLKTALDLTKALGPLSQTMFKVLKPLLDAIDYLANHLPGVIQLLWGVYTAMNAIKIATAIFAGITVVYNSAIVLATLLTEGWTAAIVASNAAFELNPVVAIITIILVALALLAAGVIYAYKHFTWFHNAVNAAWNGIKIATLFLWNNVLKPTFDAIVWAVKGIGDGAMWLWQNAIKPAFHGIEIAVKAVGDAAVWLWNNAIKPAFDGISIAVKAVGDAAMWLWNNAIKPAFDFIDKAARILATILILVLITPVILAFKALSLVANWLWKSVISPVFGWIGDKAVWLYNKAIKPQFKAITDTVHNVGDAAKWLWNNAIKPAFGWIADKAHWLYDKGVKAPLRAVVTSAHAVGDAAKWMYNNAIKPAFGWIADKAKWLYDKGVRAPLRAIVTSAHAVGDAAHWLWDKAIHPIFGWIADKAKWLYDKGIKPPFANIRKAVSLLSDSFKTGRDNIKKSWDQISGIAKKPVKFIIDHVYNEGIVPLWNKVAKITGASPLKAFKGFHTGGIMPGYTPGRDNQLIAVGGGEAIMRPEVTRAVGAGRIHALNAAARGGGVAGVQRAIGAGMPAFADGGIVGWLKDKAKGVGDFASDAAGFLDPSKMFDKVKNLVTGRMNSLDQNPWAKQLEQIPVKMLEGLKSKALSLVGFGGEGGENVTRALTWAKTQNGKPYQWGGNGNPSWDCSGFMSAIESVIRGQAPHRRWATGSFSGNTAPPGWVHNLAAPFQIGVTNKGVGHTAGTIDGVNVESRAGGIHVGKSARGAHDSYFDGVYGFKPSISAGNSSAVGPAQTAARQMLGEFGWSDSQWPALKALWQHESNWRTNANNPSSGAYGIPQALPGKKMASVGSDWRTNALTQVKWGLGYIKGRPDYGSPSEAWSKWQSRSPHWYDDGGYLQPGLNLVANGTGKPEPVFTSGQWDDIRASKSGGGVAPELHASVRVFVGSREITDIVDTQIEMHDSAAAADMNTGRRI